jgi:hypothetical protein
MGERPKSLRSIEELLENDADSWVEQLRPDSFESLRHLESGL